MVEREATRIRLYLSKDEIGSTKDSPKSDVVILISRKKILEMFGIKAELFQRHIYLDLEDGLKVMDNDE